MPRDPFGSDPFADDTDSGDPFAAPAPVVKPEGSHWGDYAGTALRGLAGFFGSEGLLPGAAIQGAGELGAQTLERIGGSRTSYNLPQVGASAAIGAVPFGKAAGIGAKYLKGALFGGGSSAAMEAAREVGDDEGLDASKIGRAGVGGTIWGTAGAGAGHLLEKVFGGRVPTLPQEEPRGPARSITGPKLRNESNVVDVAGGGAPESFHVDDPNAPSRQTPQVRQSSNVHDFYDEGSEATPFTVGHEPQVPRVRAPSNVRDIEGPAQPWFDPATAERQNPTVRAENRVVDLGGGGDDPFRTGLDTQTPQVRQPSNVRDIEGAPEPFTDAPEPQRPQLRQPSNVTDVPGPGRPDPWFDGRLTREREIRPTPRDVEAPNRYTDPTAAVEPFETSQPSSVSDTDLDAAFSRSNNSFLDRFMTAIDAGTERRAREGSPSAPKAVASGETAVTRAQKTGKTYVPSEIATAYQALKPKWAKTAADTGVKMGEEPIDFARRVLGTEDPKRLMGAERKARKAAVDAGKPMLPGTAPVPLNKPYTNLKALKAAKESSNGSGGFLGDESGGIDPVLARQLGIHVASGLAGATVAGATSDDEHRGRNIVGGAIAGAAAPLAFGKGGADALSKLRYFSMLGSTSAQAKNVAGNAGSVLVRAGEEALIGNHEGAKKILATVFSRDTADKMIQSFKHSDRPHDSRWGGTSGALGVPSRMMHAVDEGATQGLRRSGLSEDESRTSLFTSNPKSKTGQAINQLGRHIPVVMPFTRTATNMVERGMEHTPGIGMLPAVRAMRGSTTNRAVARQAMGALALAAGAGVGSSNPYVAAALGPLALPFAAGTAARTAYDKRHGDPFTNVAKSQGEVLRQNLPLPSDAYEFDPSRILASFVPGVLKDASEVDPRDLEQSGLFDSAIAKIPFLNTALLKRKPRRAHKP